MTGMLEFILDFCTNLQFTCSSLVLQFWEKKDVILFYSYSHINHSYFLTNCKIGHEWSLKNRGTAGVVQCMNRINNIYKYNIYFLWFLLNHIENDYDFVWVHGHTVTKAWKKQSSHLVWGLRFTTKNTKHCIRPADMFPTSFCVIYRNNT